MNLSPLRLAITLCAATSLMWTACDDDDKGTDDTTVADTTVDDTTVADTNDTTVEDTTVEDTTVEDTTVEDTTVEDTTMDDTIDDDTTMEDTTVEDTTMADTTLPPATNVTTLRAEIDAASELPVASTTVVTGAVVTAIKPGVGDDAEGFFIQDGPTGPAIFVAYDLSGPDDTDVCGPAKGDVVDFTVSALDVSNDLALVTTLSGLACTSSGTDLGPWTQSLDAEADLDAILADYESELIAVSGDVTRSGGAGSGHVALNFVNPAGGTARLRMPEAVLTIIESGLTRPFDAGCTFVLDGTPLWRFRDDAQPALYTDADAADAILVECLGTELVSAVARSPMAIGITFSRDIDGDSITDATTQITVDNGITIASAMVLGQTVILTTNEVIATGTTYTVTVANTVKDADDIAIVDGAMATFEYTIPEKLLVNEIDYDEADAEDAEFVEIHNPNATAVLLAGYSLVLANGSSSATTGQGRPYRTVDLADAGESLAAGGYLVVHDTGLAIDAAAMSIDMGGSFSIQNGNDAASVLFNGTIVDSLAYQGAVPGAGEGTFAPDEPNADGVYLARCPDAADTDDNSVDFALTSTVTPGAANVCTAIVE
ncbi:MAG: hypothetical protein ACI9MR_001018 [Myxococcota bacterium]|jgi:hypothetical protein